MTGPYHPIEVERQNFEWISQDLDPLFELDPNIKGLATMGSHRINESQFHREAKQPNAINYH